MTRTGLVVKNKHFSPKNGDENGARRQKWVVFGSKRRREQGSSPKNSGFHQKMVTRISLVVKKERFSPKNGDENGARRQKQAFLTQKR
ncbi:hypothetical protein [Caldibacillus thermoamylovorans]|uniref:hypothetical protein n=1 Tax=Caldibacillus thermoamylovorans TaxID=35841 RepID=UPI00203C1080|nr:hypothetical protein [Caldibacillus thermoamylovorans]MCM3054103.1 hypothetical protein [Caldibacillus thermoamylovorans]